MRPWRRREYRLYYLELIILGIAASSGWPLISIFLTSELHVSAPTASLFFTTTLMWPLVTLISGRLSDTLASRRPLIWGSALWLAIGWLILALSSTLWLAIIVGALFFCAMGTLGAQLFAMLNAIVDAHDETRRSAITGSIRGGYSLGYIVGPVLGGLMMTLSGPRSAFLLTAGLYVVSTVPTLWLHPVAAPAATARPHIPRALTAERRRLLWLALALTLVISGDAVKLAYLPLRVVHGLGASTLVLATVLAALPLGEVVAMPLAGRLADRLGARTVLIGGLLVGTADYTLLASASSLWQLYLVQGLHALVIAAIFGVGVSYAHRLDPHEPGLATSAFFSAQAVAGPLGSLIGALGVAAWGVPHVFYAPAALCAIGSAMLTLQRAGAPARQAIVVQSSSASASIRR